MAWRFVGLWTVGMGLLFAIACSSTAQAQKKLSGAEIKRGVPGSYVLEVYGFDLSIAASRQGGLRISILGSSFNGTWAVRGDSLCVTLKIDGKAQTECSAVIFDGNKRYRAGGVTFIAK